LAIISLSLSLSLSVSLTYFWLAVLSRPVDVGDVVVSVAIGADPPPQALLDQNVLPQIQVQHQVHALELGQHLGLLGGPRKPIENVAARRVNGLAVKDLGGRGRSRGSARLLEKSFEEPKDDVVGHEPAA